MGKSTKKMEEVEKAARSVLSPSIEKFIAQVAPQPIAAPEELWQIVLVGQIDHRVHHPFWYKDLGVLSEQEFSVARDTFAAGNAFCFDCGSFSLVVYPDKWQIQTTARNQRNRLAEIAYKVFDEKYFELPLLAFGINAHLHKKTTAKDAILSLAAVLSKIGLGFELNGEASVDLAFRNEYDGRTVYKSITRSPIGQSYIYLNYNGHHSLTHHRAKFKIEEDMKPWLDQEWSAAEAYASFLSAKIGQIAKG